MATINFLDGQCIDKPPFFNGENYDIWRKRMKTFLLAIDFNILYACEHDLSKLKLNEKFFSFNAQAMNIICCALDSKICDKISHFNYAYDVWNFLDNMYNVENSLCTTNDFFHVRENYNSQNQEKFHGVEKVKCYGSSLCLMAHSDNDSGDDSDENEVNHKSLTYDELYDAFESMHQDLEKLGSKYVKLSKKYKTLSIENKSLINENACLKNGANNVLLHNEVDSDCDEKNVKVNRIKFLEKENEDLKSLSCELKLELNDLRNNNEKIESFSLELKDEIASLKNKIIDLETSNTSLENDKLALIDKIKFIECDSHEKNDLLHVLKEKELLANKELEIAKESIKKLTIGAQKLDKIIDMGKPFNDKRGLGYVDENSSSNSKTIFVKATPSMPKNILPNVSNFVESKFVPRDEKSRPMHEKSKFVPKHDEKFKCMHIAKFVPRHKKAKNVDVKSKFVPRCHFCGVKGHIRPNCFKLKNGLKKNFLNISNVKNQFIKKKFLPNVTCYSCGKIGHKFNSCYLSKMNASNVGTKKKWVPKIETNLHGPKQVWVPKTIC